MKRNFAFVLALGIVLASGMALAQGRVAGARPLVQIAILLDTSNSMDGLIEQTKAELWNIVNEFANAKKGGARPELQVALYEYGKSTLPASEGYIRKILPFTSDLDKLSEELFGLKTNGGDEYCGWVIKRASEELEWSKNPGDFKLVIIAGNEPFNQGSVNYKDSCKKAIGTGIMINTIFCGPIQEGINTFWKDGAVLADGKFMNIDQNKQIVHIVAPQDQRLAELGAKLNSTYIAYGAEGKKMKARQEAQDSNAAGVSAAVVAQRTVSKSSGLYRNESWDLVDATEKGEVALDKLEEEQLPEEMRGKSKEEQKKMVAEKKKEREALKAEIAKLNAERKAFVAKKEKEDAEKNKDTLKSVLLRSIKEQAGTKDFEFGN